ncbi:hypothetical protein BZG02_15040 [Labilibaculum filiforme]|uniref:Uncharacterized protein n=1 Tax=Labilibaculum filiforme TaxID=1940526 RepID=A0A2N3HUJ2_9BACT|nr:hypothetical protein [Labilibaculum filiforme]PKQ61735.1 hypothetical protein BZG02_15040 [Labilibaculum filiforme]
MEKNTMKPSAEAKALSLFLMAYKTKDPIYKEKSKRINKQWNLVKSGELSNSDYMDEVNKMLTSYGGYSAVVEKTVQFYIEKTGEWKLEGKDEYCQDARRIADKILKK